MATTSEKAPRAVMSTLPGDDLRQLMWNYADRFELQMLVQASRSVARGPVAHMVANGARNTHEWTAEKNELLAAFDESGITAAFMDPEFGGYVQGPKNLVLALIAFELAWVDAGAATGSLAGNLGLSPIHECGTPAQRTEYLTRAIPPQPGEDRKVERAAFALTEPLPYVGVDTGVLSGRVRVSEWKEGQEPMLHVEKRGRFITNMDFANIVTAAVDSDDERIKGSCMVILEESDEGTFDRGAPTLKMVHQLSSTRDPVFNMKVPASRIIGGYEIKDGVIVPNLNHSQIIESVFKRTRVTVGLMTAAKLLSAIEPVMRYQRQRYRGGSSGQPGSPRYELGIQMKEDALHRLVDVWATGEAAAALGFEAARVFDEFDPLECEKEAFFKANGIEGRRNVMKATKEAEAAAIELLALRENPGSDNGRAAALEADLMTRYTLTEAVASVLCPATKLWNTGHGARMLREAISLMGGYGITEDCPGFLFQKWMDSQLEATYEGPEAVQRRQLSVTMLSPVFLAQFRRWTRDMRRVSAARPGTGACTIASAMDMWLWTLEHLQTAKDADGNRLYQGSRQGVTFPLADALCWLLSARQLILNTIRVEEQGPTNPVLAEGLEGIVAFYQDLCHVQSAAAAGEVGRICAELLHGYNRHPAWDDREHRCFTDSEVEAIGAVIPGFGGGAGVDDIEGDDGSHALKAGPCATCGRDIRPFLRMRVKLDGCLTGSRLAKDNAAQALTQIMIPEALDYPI